MDWHNVDDSFDVIHSSATGTNTDPHAGASQPVVALDGKLGMLHDVLTSDERNIWPFRWEPRAFPGRCAAKQQRHSTVDI